MWHSWGGGEVFTGLSFGGPKVRDKWEDLRVGGRIILSWTLGRYGLSLSFSENILLPYGT
jgi:hypothetical protein